MLSRSRSCAMRRRPRSRAARRWPASAAGWRRSPEAGVTALSVIAGEPWDDFALLDSGHGRKLERYGSYRFIRPEPQAMWAPAAAEWQADGEFVAASDDDGGGRW